MSRPLCVGLDLREVSGSGRGYRRMMRLVDALDRMDPELRLELFSDRTPLLTGRQWSEATRIVSPSRVLRAMYRPALGHLRTALWGEARVMHFLTADCWEAPTCKTVVTLHDLAPLDLPELFFEGAEGEQRYRDHLDRIFRVADRVVTVSDFSEREILDRYPESHGKVQRIYQGVDPEFFPEDWGVQDRRWFREKIGAPEGFLLYCGGIDGRKNLGFLLEAFKLFRERSESQRRLLIVGNVDSPKRGMEPLRETVKRLALEESVLFPGWISDPFLRRHYCSASLFVFPSKMEGFGYSPLEAMACGCPVLCSNAAALPETLAGAAHTLPPEDPSTWADAMERLLADTDRRKELVARGKVHSASFRWEQTAEEFLQVYRNVAETYAS